MAAMAAADVQGPAAVKERLEAFAAEVLAPAMNRPVQARNGGLYLRGLLEEGTRKSLEPLVARLGGGADYQSLQQFLADSTWDPEPLLRAVAERVAPRIGVAARVVDSGRLSQGRGALAGGQAPVFGHPRQDRQLSDRRLAARRRQEGDRAPRLGALPARGVVRGRAAAAQGEDPRLGRLSDQAAAGRRSGENRGRLGRAQGAAPRRRGLRPIPIT